MLHGAVERGQGEHCLEARVSQLSTPVGTPGVPLSLCFSQTWLCVSVFPYTSCISEHPGNNTLFIISTVIYYHKSYWLSDWESPC